LKDYDAPHMTTETGMGKERRNQAVKVVVGFLYVAEVGGLTSFFSHTSPLQQQQDKGFL
jgi:hypothetical protein